MRFITSFFRILGLLKHKPITIKKTLTVFNIMAKRYNTSLKNLLAYRTAFFKNKVAETVTPRKLYESSHPEINSYAHQILRAALRLKRKHGGAGVEELMKVILKEFPAAKVDNFGNIHLDLRENDKNTTLFVAHLDTVHNDHEANDFIDELGLIKAKGGDVLGADDGVGVAFLCALAKKGVKGYYLFTQGEEVGGLGAKYIAKNKTKMLKDFQRAIEWDRKGTDEIITHQRHGVRGCSDAFANSLAGQFNKKGLKYKPSDKGAYTDTFEFFNHIPNCTNIGCGYYNAHTPDEYIDSNHFNKLLDASIETDWDNLDTTKHVEPPSKRPTDEQKRRFRAWSSGANIPYDTAWDKFEPNEFWF